jgi:hypothetical protein
MKMHNKPSLLFALAFLIVHGGSLQAQQTYFLVPAEDAVTTFQFPNQNWGNHLQLSAYAWTQGGVLSIHRSYIRYDLTLANWSRPLLKATLHLKHFDPGPWSNQGMNAIRIGLADTSWHEDSITWNNQPQMDSLYFVDVGATVGPVDISVDVTDMVLYAFENGNNGFVIQLLEEQIYRMVLFGSRENEGFIPLLELEFVDYRSICRDFSGNNHLTTVNISSAHAQPNRVNPEVLQIGQLQASPFEVQRVFMRPDYGLLPPSYHIDYANLKFIKTDSAVLENTGFNALEVLPLNQGFDTQLLSWNNQPSFNNSVSAISAPSRGNRGTLNINMFDLVEFSRSQGNHHGYLIKTKQEALPGKAYFGGSGNASLGYRPKLTICYTANVSVAEQQLALNFVMFPNPASEELNINFTEALGTELMVLIKDLQGRLIIPVHQITIEAGQTNLAFDTRAFPSGIYTVECRTKSSVGVKKLVISR